MGWAQQPATARVTSVGSRRMTGVRGFARYLAGIDDGTQVPPLGLIPQPQRRRRPFIYSSANIDAVMDEIRCAIGSPLRVATY